MNLVTGVVADLCRTRAAALGRRVAAFAAVAFLVVGPGSPAHAQVIYEVVKAFDTQVPGEGLHPSPGLSMGADGALYGVTYDGGQFLRGTVFRLDSAGNVSYLHHFSGGPDGAGPYGELLLGSDHRLYGMTIAGGTSNMGTVFVLDGAALTTLHSFGGADGNSPRGALAEGPDGHIYGVTAQGGTFDVGVIYRVSKAGAFTLLHEFGGNGNVDGRAPSAGLLLGDDGKFYGVTIDGGMGFGTIFSVDLAGGFAVVHRFNDSGDGGRPNSEMVQTPDGRIYGTSSQGGLLSGGTPWTGGTIFSFVPGEPITTHHHFSGADGGSPWGGLISDPAGTLYGVTRTGGANNRGTIFRFVPGGALTTLHAFEFSKGADPYSAPIRMSDGTFYGTTDSGGAGNGGTIYRLIINQAPVADDQATSVARDSSVGIVLTGSDPESQPLTFTVVSGPSQGTLMGAAPNLTYTPAAGYTGADSFTFTVNDGDLESSPATVAITVVAPNAPPVADSQSVSVSEGGARSILLTGSDADGDPISFAVVGSPAHGTLSGSAPNLVYTAAAAFVGTDSFTFRVNDGAADSNLATVTLTVGVVKILHSFDGAGSGAYPTAPLVAGADGALYGTTYYGGADDRGAVFKLDATGTVTTLHSFTGGSDGRYPSAGLALGRDGDFYGVTSIGGTFGLGTAFKIDATGTLTTLHHFAGGSEGAYPQGELVQAPDGAFYGTTQGGGAPENGTVFRLDADGTLTTIRAFERNTDGEQPYAGLTLADDGSLVGVNSSAGPNGCGTVFKVDSARTFALLHAFDCNDGSQPYGRVLAMGDGSLVGTTYTGDPDGPHPHGTVWQIDSAGTFTTLYAFTAQSDGRAPGAGLTVGGDGALYGTTGEDAGGNRGTVFRIDGSGVLTTLYTFRGTGENGIDGANPVGELMVGNDGFFYGLTAYGGEHGFGAIYRVRGPANRIPVAESDSLLVNEDGSAPVTLTGSDADGDPLVYRVTAGPRHGTLSGTAPNLTYTPAANFTGTDQFGFRASDGTADSAAAFVTITVSGDNDAPVAHSQSAVTATSTPLYLTLTGSDVDGDALTFAIASGPAHGTLSGAAPDVTYTPAPGYAGPDSFTFTVNDGALDSGTATVTITVGQPQTVFSFGGVFGTTPRAGLIQAADGALYGTTWQNGAGGHGTVYKVDLAGNAATVAALTASHGGRSEAEVTEDSQGNFYGTTTVGGAFGFGTVFKVDPAGTLTTLHDFNGADGRAPHAALVNGGDGFVYGTTYLEGSGNGTVFRIDDAGTLTTLHHFTGGADGNSPMAGMVLGADGQFYGTTAYGGAHGAGTIFRIDATGALTTLHAFTPMTDGDRSRAELVQAADGTFWGTASEGGPDDAGTIFRIDTTGQFTRLHAFSGGTDGGFPAAGLFQASDGNFYGTTFEGGAFGFGTVFRIGASGTFATVHHFTGGADGSRPVARLMQASDGHLYGTASQGGANNVGVVYRLALSSNQAPVADEQAVTTTIGEPVEITLTGSDPDGGALTYTVVDPPLHGTLSGAAPALTYTPEAGYIGPDSFTFTVNDGALESNVATVTIAVGGPETLFSFGGLFGIQPWAALVQGADGALYGTTTQGGGGRGTVFRIDLAGNATTVGTFTSSQGATPLAEVIQDAQGDLYGTTTAGGTSNYGTVFKVDTGGTLTTLHEFDGADGRSPRGPLVNGGDGFFYGTTFVEGSGNGTVFRIDAAGNLTTLHSFTGGADGNSPHAGLILAADGNLYGTNAYGGAFGVGTIFRMSKAGTITPLHSFNRDTDGARSRGELVEAADGAFWGTTYEGGTHGRGTIFRLDSSGQFTVMHMFSGGSDGGQPDAGLLQASDGHFYGTTYQGGTHGFGTVFRIDNGGTLTTLHQFSGGDDGSRPAAALMQATDGHLYGTTTQGGANDRGVVYRIVIAANQAPVADSQAVTTSQGTPVDITLTASDPDGDALTYTIVDAPAHGTLSGSAPALVYTPAAGYSGADSFTFMVNDGSADSNVATVSIDVVPATTIVLGNPDGGEKVFVNSAYPIRWTATNASAIDVELSRDGGKTYASIAECSGLPGSATSCLWTPTAPTSSKARIRVTARDAGAGSAVDTSSSAFAIVSGTPAVKVTAPNKTVTWSLGSTQVITWTHNLGAGSTMRIELSRDNGASWEVLDSAAINASGSGGSLSWVVTGPATNAARVRATWTDGATTDVSDVAFAIAAPSVTITAPNVGAPWRVLGEHRVIWTHNLETAETMRVEMSFDNGATWTLVTASAPNASATSGRYEWVVQGPVTTQARVRVTANSNSAVTDINDMPFPVNPAITVTMPTTNTVVWAAGSTRTIVWQHFYGAAQAFDIDFSADNGLTWSSLATSVLASSANAGTYTMVTPSTLTSEALIRVSPAGNVANADVSNVPFRIVAPAVTVTGPSTVTVGTTVQVKWTHNLGTLEAMDVELSRDGGATWTTIASNVMNSAATKGEVAWLVTGPTTTTGRFRVTWRSNPAVQDENPVRIR